MAVFSNNGYFHKVHHRASRAESHLEFIPKAVSSDGKHIILPEMKDSNLTSDVTKSLSIRQHSTEGHYKSGIAIIRYRNGYGGTHKILSATVDAESGLGVDVDDGDVITQNYNDKYRCHFFRHMGIDEQNKITDEPIVIALGPTYIDNDNATYKLDAGEGIMLPMQLGWENDSPALVATGDCQLSLLRASTANPNKTVKVEVMFIIGIND